MRPISTKEKSEVQTTRQWKHEKKRRRMIQWLIINLLTGGNVFNRFPSNHNSVKFGRDPTLSGYLKKNQRNNWWYQNIKNCLIIEIASALTGNFFARIWFLSTDFIVPRNKRNTIGFFCFAFDKKMPLGKSTFFCIRYFSKTKQRIAKKKAGHCLIHLTKCACQIWSCFGNVQF